ncbi:MAG: phage tail protein [Clostridia bacterium]|nr:phage tail protein [Clostridia bacterium]
MIVYFADRQLNIIGSASTGLPDGSRIVGDLLTRDVEGGTASFECTVVPYSKSLQEVEEIIFPCNHVLLMDGDKAELFSIIDAEYDTAAGTVWLSAESGGLDLLNDVLEAFENSASHTIDWYANQFLSGTGFEIRLNEVSTASRTCSWTGEATITDRLLSLANEFDAELSYAFEVDGVKVTHRYVNFHKRIGKNVDVPLRVGREIESILITRSAADLATALLPTGSSVTLSGYSYDDGDYYVDGKYLKSRTALDEWARVNFRHIVKTYQSQATTQATLFAAALTQLKKARHLTVKYEVKLAELPANIGIGDTVHLADEKNGIYLSARIMQLKTSESDERREATLGDITEE